MQTIRINDIVFSFIVAAVGMISSFLSAVLLLHAFPKIDPIYLHLDIIVFLILFIKGVYAYERQTKQKIMNHFKETEKELFQSIDDSISLLFKK